MKGKMLKGVVFVVIVSMALTPMLALAGEINSNSIPAEQKEVKISGAHSYAALSGPVKVAGTQYDEYQPKVISDANGNLLVAYTVEYSVMDTDVLLAASTDGGATWNSVTPPWGATREGLQYSPSLMYAPNGGVIIGTLADENIPAQLLFKIADVSNPDTYAYSGWGGFDDIYYSTVTYTTFEDGTKVIVTPLVGNTAGFEGTCMWAYNNMEDLSGIGGVYYYDAQSVSGTYSDAENMEGFAFAGNHYGFVCDAFRDATQQYQPLIKWTKYEEQPDLEYTTHQFWMENGSIQARDPDAYGSGNNIYVVYEIFDPTYGDWNIKCVYSHDGGASWNSSMVADQSLVDERHPAVYASGNDVYVVYIKQGNLYLVESKDGGATWGQPQQINDNPGSVVSEDGAADISAAGIVWVDNRDGNKDIYYAPLPAPRITISKISGGIGVTVSVQNTGTEDAKNVAWSIDVSGGLVILGKHHEGTIASLPAGGSATIKSGLVLGIGKIKVDVNVGGVTKEASGFLLGPLILGLK